MFEKKILVKSINSPRDVRTAFECKAKAKYVLSCMFALITVSEMAVGQSFFVIDNCFFHTNNHNVTFSCNEKCTRNETQKTF